jgi:undecaprenyl-diphosphatase
MKKKYLYISIFSLSAFVLWTLLLCFVDVRAIGPEGSSVGLATLNGYVHEKIGVNMYLYNITDWLGLVPIGVALGFAILGLIQLIKRKSLLRVDRSILALGVFYIIVVAVYLFFESVIINYRPVLIEGCLEASYPSSTTMLVTCVMPTAAMQAKSRIKSKALRQGIIIAIIAFTAFMVFGRLISGVHWISDIIGGALFSLGIVLMYKSFI